MGKLIARFLTILGAFLIGLGIGVIIGWQVQWQNYLYWLVLCSSLIFGSFLLAWAMMEGKQKEEIEKREEKEKKENNSENL